MIPSEVQESRSRRVLLYSVVLLSIFINGLFFFLVWYSGLYNPFQSVQYSYPLWANEDIVQVTVRNVSWETYQFNIKTEQVEEIRNGDALDPFPRPAEEYDEGILRGWRVKLDLKDMMHFAPSPSGKYVAIVGEPHKKPWEQLNAANKFYVVNSATLETQRISSIDVISESHLAHLGGLGKYFIVAVFVVTVGLNFSLLRFFSRRNLGVYWIILVVIWLFVYVGACLLYVVSLAP